MRGCRDQRAERQRAGLILRRNDKTSLWHERVKSQREVSGCVTLDAIDSPLRNEPTHARHMREEYGDTGPPDGTDALLVLTLIFPGSILMAVKGVLGEPA